MSSAGFELVAGRIPGEEIARTTVTSDSSTFTTTETLMASVTAALVSGRVYKIVFDAAFEITVDGVLRVSIHEDNVSGTVLNLRDCNIDNSGTATGGFVQAYYTAVSTANKTFVATGDVLVGGGTANLNAAATFPTYLYVEYVSG